MNTLRHTIGKLQWHPIESDQTEDGGEGLLEALVNEIERMAQDSLYRGRPLGTAASGRERAQDSGTDRSAPSFETLELEGVEVLEGRFDRTNDRLVGLFEEGRGDGPAGAWVGSWTTPRVERVVPLTTPIQPFSLSRTQNRFGGRSGGLLANAQTAGAAAAQLRAQILASARHSVESQANTSERVVTQLLRSGS